MKSQLRLAVAYGLTIAIFLGFSAIEVMAQSYSMTGEWREVSRMEGYVAVPPHTNEPVRCWQDAPNTQSLLASVRCESFGVTPDPRFLILQHCIGSLEVRRGVGALACEDVLVDAATHAQAGPPSNFQASIQFSGPERWIASPADGTSVALVRQRYPGELGRYPGEVR